MKTQILAPKKFRLLLILLTVSLSLSACQSVPAFPVKYVWEIDVTNHACGQYEIIDSLNFKFRHVQDWPLEKCNGLFGFTSQDVPKVFDWCKDVASLAKNKCSAQ